MLGNFNFGTKVLKKGTTPAKATKAAPAKKAPVKAAPAKKAAPKKPSFSARSTKAATAVSNPKGGVGYRKFEGRPLWIPNAEIPAWLDGSLPGDRGFDPLGLAKPVEYLQVDIDQLDQNKATNKAGQVIGTFTPNIDKVEAGSLQPYSEVFGIGRFRETELIHGRWAMLATLGVLVAEYNTGVAWQDAGKVELDGLTYFGFDLPFTLTQVVWFEVLAVGGAEIYRNLELDTEKRCYPGGPFDPLNLAGGDPAKAFKLKEAELKHGRLAMVSFFGYGVQALYTGNGAFESLAQIADEF
jgi:light-harvesting complex II chlorophyll a/b binding protein 4